MNANRRLCWIDLETTGFTELNKKSVYRHKILEIGALVTDHQFKEIARLSIVIHHDLVDVVELCDDVVMKMHTQNGLFQDMQKACVSLEEAETLLINFLIDNGIERKGSPLCGSGIGFDRIFIETHLPALNDHLHYRNLDISAVKEFIKTIDHSFEPKKRLAHRAMDDIVESVIEAKTYRSLIAPALEKATRKIPESESLSPY